HQGAGGEYAMLGTVRAAKSGLSRGGPAARSDGSGGGGTGFDDGLGPVCRHEGDSHWHAYLWDVCPAQGFAGQVRLYPGEDCQCCQGTTYFTGVTSSGLWMVSVCYLYTIHKEIALWQRTRILSNS